MDHNFLLADSDDCDQTGRMPRLIWVFAERTGHFFRLVMLQIISFPEVSALPKKKGKRLYMYDDNSQSNMIQPNSQQGQTLWEMPWRFWFCFIFFPLREYSRTIFRYSMSDIVSFSSHILVAGCDMSSLAHLSVRSSVRSCVRLSTIHNTLASSMFLCNDYSCKCQTLYSSCPYHTF